MTSPTGRSGDDRDGDAHPGRHHGAGAPGGLAGWQKVVGIVGLAVVVVLAVLLASGDHGPGRHAPGGMQEQSARFDDVASHERAPGEA